MKIAPSAIRAAWRRVRLGPASRVSIGLVSLMLGGLLALDLWFGVLPDRSTPLRELRECLSRDIGTQVVSTLTAGDTLAVQRELQRQLQRNQQVLSLGVRRQDGNVVAQTAAHWERWKAPSDAGSDLDHVRVPLRVADQRGADRRWGDVEISFDPVVPHSVSEWARQPAPMLFLLLGVTCFIVFTLYLRRVFDYLDPSAVIPTRVRTAFDALTEGVLVLDSSGRTVMANAAFRVLAAHCGTAPGAGKPVQAMSWLAGVFGNDPQDHPWTRAMRLAKAQRGLGAELMARSGEPMKFLVNCAPIKDARGKVRGCIVTFTDMTGIERVNAEPGAAMGAVAAPPRRPGQQLLRVPAGGDD